MNLERMLKKCRAGQWRTEDLDWSRAPRPMMREEEQAVVQYFTDMAGIERLAASLFEEQAARAEDRTLAQIFTSFVEDERRHARAAELLAKHYDVHQYRQYRQSEQLSAFAPAFVNALRLVPPELLNMYVTLGELMLDVALLRSIDVFVDDPMSQAVMTLINRDEARHIAMDFYMTEYYASAAYQARFSQSWAPSVGDRAKGLWAFLQVMHHARPFLRAVFLDPMERVDPTGERLQEAFARFEALLERPAVQRRPLPQIIRTVRALASHPSTRKLALRVARAGGIPSQLVSPASKGAA